jgi:hypothetical protein
VATVQELRDTKRKGGQENGWEGKLAVKVEVDPREPQEEAHVNLTVVPEDGDGVALRPPFDCTVGITSPSDGTAPQSFTAQGTVADAAAGMTVTLTPTNGGGSIPGNPYHPVPNGANNPPTWSSSFNVGPGTYVLLATAVLGTCSHTYTKVLTIN